jgi:hypothetical protein
MVKHLAVLVIILQAVLLFVLMTDLSPFRYGLLNDWLLIAITVMLVYSYQYVIEY